MLLGGEDINEETDVQYGYPGGIWCTEAHLLVCCRSIHPPPPSSPLFTGGPPCCQYAHCARWWPWFWAAWRRIDKAPPVLARVSSCISAPGELGTPDWNERRRFVDPLPRLACIMLLMCIAPLHFAVNVLDKCAPMSQSTTFPNEPDSAVC